MKERQNQTYEEYPDVPSPKRMKEKGVQNVKTDEYGRKPKVLRGAITQTPAQKNTIRERINPKHMREMEV